MSAFFRSCSGSVPSMRRERNTDAGADHHLMLLDDERRAQGFDDAGRKRRRVQRLGSRALQNDELVAAHAGDGIGLPDAAAQPTGDCLQQRVADGVPKGVVDLLEAVEIQAQHGDRALLAGADERLLQALGQQYAIGQIGERIMVRHVGDFGFVAMPLGEVADRVDLVAAQSRCGRAGKRPRQG